MRSCLLGIQSGALCLFGIDVLIIYGLAAYGGQHEDVI